MRLLRGIFYIRIRISKLTASLTYQEFTIIFIAVGGRKTLGDPWELLAVNKSANCLAASFRLLPFCLCRLRVKNR